MIADIETRWNSCYLARKRLIKIKDLIDILASTMLIDPDPSTRRDGKRLKSINLTDNEWQAISKLIVILEDFAGATEYLGVEMGLKKFLRIFKFLRNLIKLLRNLKT